MYNSTGDDICCTYVHLLQALVEQLDKSTKQTRSSKVEELCNIVHGDSAACSESRNHELWAWEEHNDVDKVLSDLVWEQTEFVMALQAKLQKLQQIL